MLANGRSASPAADRERPVEKADRLAGCRPPQTAAAAQRRTGRLRWRQEMKLRPARACEIVRGGRCWLLSMLVQPG